LGDFIGRLSAASACMLIQAARDLRAALPRSCACTDLKKSHRN
jgi:hypothetical protein